jgi:hypothetical protein
LTATIVVGCWLNPRYAEKQDRSASSVGTALAVPAASAIPEAATHAMVEFATAEVGDAYTMIDAATHAMTEAVAEFAVLTILASIGTVG